MYTNSNVQEVVFTEFQCKDDCFLNTQEARKDFYARYKDPLYDLAYTLTHNQRQACNLVVGAFQQAFQKYAATPCPDDSYPFLSSTVYLLFAKGDETKGPYSHVPSTNIHTNSCPAGSAVRMRNNQYPERTKDPVSNRGSHPVQNCVSVQEENASDQETLAITVEEQPEKADPEPNDVKPRHAQKLQTDFSQPLSQQVFDPEHTDYWTPGMEQNRTPSAQQRLADSSAPARNQAGSTHSASAASQQQPNISQAYMYDEKAAKKRKSPFLQILNTLLFLLFIWMAIGLLIRMDVMPQWNLGYAWFNLYIFPLF